MTPVMQGGKQLYRFHAPGDPAGDFRLLAAGRPSRQRQHHHGFDVIELTLLAGATVGTVYLVTPGCSEAMAQSVVDLAEQASVQIENGFEMLNNSGNRTLISQKDLLLKSGDFPYITPRQKGNPIAVPVHGGGFKDKGGNIWRRDKSQHAGPHWDVQLPNGNIYMLMMMGKSHMGAQNERDEKQRIFKCEWARNHPAIGRTG